MAVKAGWEDIGNNMVRNQQTGQVVDQNHPVYTNYQAPQQKIDDGVVGTPVGPPGSTVPQQAGYAQTYSSTPGAAPAPNTANQGSQDVVRNSYLQRATQGTAIDPNDPNIKQQVDPYAAAQERSRRDYLNQQAEKLSAQGVANSGQMQQEERYAAERAGQATGMFQSQLVQRELENKRNEIKDALSSLGGMISGDQARQLQRDLADLDAAIKRESLAQGGSLGGRELDIKDKLGTGALNIDLIRALLQNQQFGVDAGIRIGDLEGKYAPWF